MATTTTVFKTTALSMLDTRLTCFKRLIESVPQCPWPTHGPHLACNKVPASAASQKGSGAG